MEIREGEREGEKELRQEGNSEVEDYGETLGVNPG